MALFLFKVLTRLWCSRRAHEGPAKEKQDVAVFHNYPKGEGIHLLDRFTSVSVEPALSNVQLLAASTDHVQNVPCHNSLDFTASWGKIQDSGSPLALEDSAAGKAPYLLPTQGMEM